MLKFLKGKVVTFTTVLGISTVMVATLGTDALSLDKDSGAINPSTIKPYVDSSACGQVRTVNYTDTQHTACTEYDVLTHKANPDGKIWVRGEGKSGNISYDLAKKWLCNEDCVYQGMKWDGKFNDSEKAELSNAGLDNKSSSSASKEDMKFAENNNIYNFHLDMRDMKLHYDNKGNLLTVKSDYLTNAKALSTKDPKSNSAMSCTRYNAVCTYIDGGGRRIESWRTTSNENRWDCAHYDLFGSRLYTQCTGGPSTYPYTPFTTYRNTYACNWWDNFGVSYLACVYVHS